MFLIGFITPEIVCDSCENGLNHRYIFVDNYRNIHISYHKKVGGHWQIFYRMKTAYWQTEERVTNTTADAKYPSILVYRDSVFLVWHDYRVGGISNIEIFFNAKPISGTSWDNETRLTYTNSGGPGDNGYLPTIKQKGGNIYVVWYDYRDDTSSMNAQIYLKVRDSTWGPDIRVSNSPGNAWYPSFDFKGDTLFIVWADSRNTNYNIYGNWGFGDYRITTNTSYYPDIATSGNKTLLVYVNSSLSPPKVFGKFYNGMFGVDFPIRNSGNSQQEPTVISNGNGGWVVAWSEDFVGDRDIFGVILDSSGNIRDSFRINMSGDQKRPSLFLDNLGYIHLTFVDYTDPTNPKIYYTKSITPLNVEESNIKISDKSSSKFIKDGRIFLGSYGIDGRKSHR